MGSEGVQTPVAERTAVKFRTARRGSASRAKGTAAKDSAAETAARSGLEETLRYRFAKPALLELALTHRSHPYEARTNPAEVSAHDAKNPPGTDNEQLEFVGDAVLGLAVTELLFREFPECSEGELTRMRANLVSRQRMATLGAELGLAEQLLVGKSAEQTGARRKPALLANAAEAVIAAMYLDANAAGKDGLGEVRRMVEERLVRPEVAGLRKALASDGGRGALRDAKTLLQERVQAGALGRLRYADTQQSGPAHQRRFVVEARIESPEGEIAVLASAEGASKKEAQQRAAELALRQWKEPLALKRVAERGENAA
jgi:ribonuclease-3